MASPDTAAALLTAESLVIAALAVFLQQRDRLFTNRNIIYRMGVKMLGVVIGTLISFSFLGSIAYLHIAEYPAGMIGSQTEPEAIFNMTIAAFIGFFLLSMAGIMFLQNSMVDDLVEIHRIMARK